MGLKAMVLAGAALATMTVGFTAPAFAAARSVPTSGQAMTAAHLTTGELGDDTKDDDVSGVLSDSPVCSALDAETIPTGDDVAKCLLGTELV